MTDDAVAALKERHHQTWAAGDYAVIAQLIEDVGDVCVEAAGIEAGQEVLDVATGTGNAALVAAGRAANVTGLDLTPELFDTARERAAVAGVEVEWVAGDAEDMPFDDASFDRVLCPSRRWSPKAGGRRCALNGSTSSSASCDPAAVWSRTTS